MKTIPYRYMIREKIPAVKTQESSNINTKTNKQKDGEHNSWGYSL